MDVVDTIQLNLKGTVVDLEMSEQFLSEIRKTFNLSQSDVVTENHIKQFLVGAMKNALDGDKNVFA